MSCADSVRRRSSPARATSDWLRSNAALARLWSSAISGISRVASRSPNFTRSPTSTLIRLMYPATLAITSTSWNGLNSAVRIKSCDRFSTVVLATATVGTSDVRAGAFSVLEHEDVSNAPNPTIRTADTGITDTCMNLLSSAIVFDDIQEFLGRKTRRQADINDPCFLGADLAGYFGKFRRDLERDGDYAVTICVQQVCRPDAQAENLDAHTVVHQVRGGVRHRDTAGEHRKPHLADTGKIAHQAIGDDGLAVKRLEDGRVHLSHTGTRTGPGRQVLDHGNPRSGKAADIAPPVGSMQIGNAGHGRIGRPHPASRGIAQYPGKAAGDALQP